MAGAKKKVMRRNRGGNVVAKKMMGGMNKAKKMAMRRMRGGAIKKKYGHVWTFIILLVNTTRD